jgi:drug/metabolite transporter (DMT)-like permease
VTEVAVSSARNTLLERFAPWLFVLLWSTGFVVAHYGTEDAGPLTFLTVRLAAAAALLWIVALATGAPRVNRRQISWAAVAGLGMHALYLGGVFVAIAHGLPSGLSALIAGLHPVVTSVTARWLLRERLAPVQWFGIGLGMIGVLAVVIDRLRAHSGGINRFTLVAMAVSVIGMAGGTLVQRARGGAMPLLRGTAVQYTTAATVLGVGAVFNEHWQFHSTPRLWFSLAWALLVLSIAAVLIMMVLLQRHAAARVSSLFFLTPALSTIEGAILFSERLGALALVGFVVALAGVYLTTRQPT